MKEPKQDDQKNQRYGLTMDRREHVALTGVQDVVSFDEQTVVLKTSGGQLVLTGQDLHVARLTLDEGQLVVDGTIDSLTYHNAKLRQKGGKLVSRMFR